MTDISDGEEHSPPSLYFMRSGTLGGKNSYESIKRYEDKAYDKVLVRMPKGRKAEIQSYAEAHGQSVNSFINRAISETMERDTLCFLHKTLTHLLLITGGRGGEVPGLKWNQVDFEYKYAEKT